MRALLARRPTAEGCSASGTDERSEDVRGRTYLRDTVKAPSRHDSGGKVILDFNFAYNPSCAFDPAWVCPLAPPPNR